MYEMVVFASSVLMVAVRTESAICSITTAPIEYCVCNQSDMSCVLSEQLSVWVTVECFRSAGDDRRFETTAVRF